VPCTYDLEIAATTYFHALEEGDIPLVLLFSGTVFTGDGSGFTVHPVSWKAETPCAVPVVVWRENDGPLLPQLRLDPAAPGHLAGPRAYKNARADSDLGTGDHRLAGRRRGAGPVMTTALADPFAAARAVADAVLYEGYVLYPYRASSSKNRTRWQWGVLMPPAYVADDPSERSAHHLEWSSRPRTPPG